VAVLTPATYYLGLSSTVPTQFKGVSSPYWNYTEPTLGTGNYARLAVPNTLTTFGPTPSEPTNGFLIQNNTTLAMATSTGPWSTGATTLIYGGLFDAAAGGNLWTYGPLSPTIAVNQNGISVVLTASQFLALLT
jgi:hypothetical protein